MRKFDMMEAYLDDYGRITVYVHEQFYQGKSDHFYLKDSTGTVIACSIMNVSRSDNSYTKYSLDAPTTIQIGKEYYVVADYALMCPLKFGYVVRTERFDKEFYYDGDDLGIHYDPKQTEFVLWAPIAIEVLVDMTSHENRMVIPMKRTEKGVFRATVPGDHDGARYVYRVNVNGRWNQAIDPYGQSACANKMAGFVINPKKTEMNMHDDCLPPFTSYTDAILYETHVRDFSKQCQTPYAGLFLGMIQKGLKTPNGNPAGFDYVKQLGITHLQLQPVADFTTVDENNPNGYYNWGYDPGHFNIPEGSYSTDPDDPYARITEFKQLVSAYHEAGIRIVMDVVYNHMHSLRNNDFEQIVPNYYFRYGPDGAPSNGSFCGNDFDSTRRMSRKFIVDSIKMWMKEYHVDGFRFDLMGILDIETMNEIVREAKKINPSVFLHGEGWNLPTMLAENRKATMGNQAALYGIAQFNDFFREHVKGKSSDYELGVCGYGTGDLNYRLAIPACLCGSAVVKEGYVTLFDTPQKSTNYIECHDNATVWDKMKNCCSEEASGVRIARQKMMTAMVLLAQGIPFLHSGQEFCRTKNGVTNSYASSDSVNRLDWDRKDRYLYVSEYVRDVIQLRKTHNEFRLKTTKEIEERVSVVILENDLLVYTIKGTEPRESVRVLINPTNKPVVYRCKGLYRLILDNKGMCKTEEKSVFTVPELSLCVIER